MIGAARDKPAMYCRQCRYILDGLPENRCPECGTGFDPGDARTFATSPKLRWISRVWRTRVGRAGSVLAGLVLLVAVAASGIEYGSRVESCPRCGAYSHVRHFLFWGIGGDYGRVTTEGPVSKFVQSESGSECVHQWQLWDELGGSLFRRRAALYGGYAGDRMSHVSNLESTCPLVTKFLQAKRDADPGFLDQLRTAMKGDDHDASDRFFEQLLLEAEEWSQKGGQ